MSASDLWQSSLETFSRSPFSSFAFLKLILYFFQLEKSLDGFSRTWIMIKQSIRVLKCVNSLRGRWLSYKCITLFIPDSWFWQESISQGFILCNFIIWKIWKKGFEVCNSNICNFTLFFKMCKLLMPAQNLYKSKD